MNSLSMDQNFTIPQSSFGVGLSQDSSNILQRLKKIHVARSFSTDKTLISQLKVMNPIELKKILECFFREMAKEGCMTDPIKFLDRLATIIPLEKMQEAVKDDIPDVLKEAKNMFDEASLYLRASRENISPSIRTRISSILDGIISIIESIVTAFGIADFFKPAESDIHADFKSHKIMTLLSLFSMITTMVLPLLGNSTGGLMIGGVLLVIAALSTIWPFIKPKTTYLPANAENWTKQVRKLPFVAQGRKESLDEIANILKMNRHAILVGPSRVGKSLAAKAFVQAIERGDYPEFKGKVVFRINTTDIVGQQASFLGGGNNILNKISAAMGRHRNDIILIFDEIHMACKNNEKIADQLKTFLDEGGEFSHVIGITTEEEYEKHVKDNHAFSLRFDCVDIENTSQEETLKILSDIFLRSHFKPLIEGDALDQIYNKSCEIEKKAPQPTSSIKLLKQCMNRTQKTQKSPTEKKILEISNKILSIKSQSAATYGRKKGSKVEIADLEKELKELQETLSREQIKLDKLFRSQDLFNRVIKEIYSSVVKISAISHKKLNSKDEKQLKIFLLLHEFLSKSLESYIREKSKKLGIKAVIDEALIEEVANA